jgi:PEP-CTERM motif
MKKTILTLIVAAGLTSFAANAKAVATFQDNFSGYSLDTSKWSQNDTGVWGYSQAIINNGSLQLNYRSILTTTSTFDFPITISGSFSLGTQAQAERLQIVTRTDGQTIGNWAEPVGMKFSFTANGVGIQFADANSNYTDFGTSTGLSLNTNTSYNFSIIDSGSTASVIINGSTVYSTAVAVLFSAGNHVSITNRERAAGTLLGPITISPVASSPVPEPSTYGLIGLGALGVAFVARRRKVKTA